MDTFTCRYKGKQVSRYKYAKKATKSCQVDNSVPFNKGEMKSVKKKGKGKKTQAMGRYLCDFITFRGTLE